LEGKRSMSVWLNEKGERVSTLQRILRMKERKRKGM
jgi:hypothetical protein